jgi:hypothetical protein
VGFALGGDANGFTIDISASAARGKADGTDETHSNTHVAAGKTLTVQSGTDTTLKGAVASGSQVVANVGGNLNLESLQDTTTFDSKQESAGFSVSLCIPPICYGSGSYSANYAKAGVKGDFASVTEQTGIKAGDGGFRVNVGGNTDLKGAVVSSTQAAVNAKANTLTTDSLTASSIDNHDVFKATSVSVSGGTGGGSGAAYQKSGDQRSVTASGISDSRLNVSGTTTGDLSTAVRTDVDSSASIGKAWDGQKLQSQVAAGASVIAQFGTSASKLVGDLAGKQRKSLEEDAKKETDPDKRKELLAEAEKWGEGGVYRVAAHAVIGAMSGNLEGALGAAGAAAAAEKLDAIQLAVQNQLTDEGVSLASAQTISKVLGASAATLVGTALGGAQGAAAAFNEDTNNRQLHPTEAKLIRENAAKYAGLRGISREQAEAELVAQSLRQVDSAWAERTTNNAAASAFLTQIATSLGPGASGKAFTSQGAAEYNNHTINADQLAQTSDLYNRLNSKNSSGVTPHVGGAYIAYNDAAHDPALAGLSSAEIQRLLSAGQGLKGQVRTAQEALAVSAASLGVAQTVFNSGKAKPGDGGALSGSIMGAVLEAAATGLPNENGGAPLTLGAGGKLGHILPTTEGNRVNSPVRVTARAEIDGESFIDTNAAHRPPGMADANSPTLVADFVKQKSELSGKLLPNSNMDNAHAEVALIQRAWEAGKTQGRDLTIEVEGKLVCGHCKSDLPAMAAASGLKSLTVKATENGVTRTVYWKPGMITLEKVKP